MFYCLLCKTINIALFRKKKIENVVHPNGTEKSETKTESKPSGKEKSAKAEKSDSSSENSDRFVFCI